MADGSDVVAGVEHTCFVCERCLASWCEPCDASLIKECDRYPHEAAMHEAVGGAESDGSLTKNCGTRRKSAAFVSERFGRLVVNYVAERKYTGGIY